MAIPGGLIGAAMEELGNMIRDGSDQINQGMPDWVKNGNPQSTNGKIAQAAARQTCMRFAADPSSFGAVDQARLPDLCAPFLGDGDTPDYVPQAPFTGGQCPIRYDVEIETTYSFRSDPENTLTTAASSFGSVPGGVLGPIGGAYRGLGSVVQADCGTGASRIRLGCYGGDGTYTWSCWNPALFIIRGVRIKSVTPKGSQPDNCGDLPPTISPPFGIDPPPPNPAPYPIPPGPGFDIDVRPDPDGGWEICVEGICVKIDPFGDEPAPPAPGPAPLPPGDQGNPGPGGTTGEGGEEEGEAPPGEVLVGLLLELIEIPPNAKQIAEGIYRGPCWIYIGGDVGLDQDFAGANLLQTQFVNAETENATRWKVIANPGYNVRVTPYYREVEESE